MNEYTAQERAAKITWLLANGERLTTKDVMCLTGLARSSAWELMMKIARVLPIVCDDLGKWGKME